MLINVELGLILCKVCVCVCVCVCPKTCSGKINFQGIQGSFCQAFAYCRAIHSAFTVWLFCFLMDLCAPPSLVECVRCLFMKFISSATLTPSSPPTARPSHPRTGHAKPVPMNGSLRGAPGRGPGLGGPELTSGQQQGRGTPSSGFAVATQCRVGSGQPRFGPLGQRGRKFGWLWCGALPHWPKRLPRV